MTLGLYIIYIRGYCQVFYFSMPGVILYSMGRTCDKCTACCDGRLRLDDINGVSPQHNACPFMGNGICNIYENRPETPCRTYSCLWKRDSSGSILEDWMSPARTNILVHTHSDNPQQVELVTFEGEYRKDDLSDINRKLRQKGIKTSLREQKTKTKSKGC